MHIVYHIIDKPIKGILWFTLRMHSFGVIWIRISDPRSLRSWYIKGTNDCTLGKDSLVPLMYHNAHYLRSLILIRHPKEMHPILTRDQAFLSYQKENLYHSFHSCRILQGKSLTLELGKN